MKHLLLTIIAAVVLVGCGETQESASTPEPEPAKSVNSKANKALLNAVNKGEIEAAKQAIADGANVGGALFGAAQNGHKEIAELLIAGGADVNAKNKGGKTPLSRAVNGLNSKIVELLIDKGADVNAKADNGWTPMHEAFQDQETAELLIAGGANVNAMSNKGQTPLDCAMMLGLPEVADLIRKHGGKTAEELKAEGK